METRPKVSILIPVYNTAGYLPKCLASVQNQTLREIEIIAVNDASPDNAAEVLAEYAGKDNRIKIITHEKNGGILAARLSGIAAATGEYLIFLDADDYLDTDTARACYAKAKKTGADMIHFCFDVRIGHKKKTHFARNVEKRINPYKKALLGSEVFEGAFVKYLYSWNIAGKCIAAEVCRKAAAALPPGYYIMAEDFCFYSMLAWFSTHYEPLFKRCYYYGLDIGVSNYGQTDYRGFLRNCTVFSALKAVKTFLQSRDCFEKYRQAYEEQERRLLDDLLERWEQKLIRYDQVRGMEYMLENYPAEGFVRSLISSYSGQEETLAGLMGYQKKLMGNKSAGTVRHIGLYLEDKAAGSALTKQLVRCAVEWKKAGWTVSIISHEDTPMPQPEGIDLIQIPAALTGSSVRSQTARNGFWFALREKHGIDTVVHGAVEIPSSIFDLIAIKSAGLNLIAAPISGIHSLADNSIGGFLVRMRSLQIADALAVLSKHDQSFYSSFGMRSVLISMPAEKQESRKHAGRKQLLWLGHFGDPEAEIVLSAWAKTAPQFPEYHLFMSDRISGGISSRCVMTLADKMNLEKSVSIIQDAAGFDAALPQSEFVFMTSGATDCPIYADMARETGIPCYQCENLTPEDLASELTARLKGIKENTDCANTAVQCSGQELFSMIQDTPDRPSAPEDLLDVLGSCRLNTEPYLLLPENRGESLIKLYRKIDSWVYRILPPASSRRQFFCKVCRYVLNRFKKGRKEQ